MSAQIRQETELFVREARRRALGLVAVLGGAVAWLALAASPMARGFGLAATSATGALLLAALVQWWRGTRLRTDVTAALAEGRAVDDLRARLARSIAWLRRVQNAALVFGVIVIVSAVRKDTELDSGVAFGLVAAIVLEQILDHAAVQRAERFDKLLEAAAPAG